MDTPELNNSYTDDDFTVLDSLEPSRTSGPSQPLINLSVRELHGISRDESERRRDALSRAIEYTAAAGLPISEDLLIRARLYISGAITWNEMTK